MLNIFDYFVYRIIRSYKGNIKNHKYDRFYPMVFANIFLFIPLNIAIYFGGLDRFWVLMVFLGIHYIGWDIFCAKRYTPARYLKFKEKYRYSKLNVLIPTPLVWVIGIAIFLGGFTLAVLSTPLFRGATIYFCY